jgi:hypothetical protein
MAEPTNPPAATRPAEQGDIFGTSDGQVVRVARVGRAGWVTVQVIGGALDGETRRVRGVPADWSRYPR